MAADTAGNDIAAVGVPLTGYLAYAPESTDLPTVSDGTLTLDEAFRKVGLIKEDGGFEWTEEPDGDPLTFWQDGYSIPTGLANVTLTFTAAEQSAITRHLRTGKTPGADGSLTVDGGGSATRYLFVSEERFRNGTTRIRTAYGRVQSAKLQKSEKGSVQGVEFTIEVHRHVAFNNDHYKEWVIPVDPPVVP